VEDVVGTTLDEVEVEVGGTVLEVLDLVLENEVDGATLLLLLEIKDVSSYISNLLPAPQYS
jgi:hypothetical protein